MDTDANPFRSTNLLYRAIETPEDDDFFHALQADPISFSTSTPAVLIPASRKITTSIRESYTDKSLLAVMICLPTTIENLNIGNDDPTPVSKSNFSEKSAKMLVPNPVRKEPLDKGIPIGAMCLSASHPGERYAHHRCADIGIDIAPKYQNKGYGGEALKWILDWGFRHGGLHRIGIRVLGWNSGALRLYQRLGFVIEGRERQAMWSRGRWWDDFGLGMLEDEWRERYGKDKETWKGAKELDQVTEEVLQ